MFNLKKNLYYFILFTLFFYACKSSEKKTFENAIGNLGTLTVVSDKATHIALKNTYNGIFLSTQNNNALIEPFNQVLQPDIKEFNDFFYNQRTVLVLVNKENYKALGNLLSPFKKDEIENYINSNTLTLKSASNLMAKNQEFLYLFGNSSQDLKNKLEINQINIIRILLKNELSAQIKALNNDSSKNIKFYSEMKTKYGVGVNIPSTFKLKRQADNFYLFQMEDNSEPNLPKTFGIIVHTYPYKDTTDFNYINVRTVRDSICKHSIPGEISGTYMSTSESDFYPTRIKEMVNLNGYKASKISAWWTVKGVSVSGPFLRYTIHIPGKNIIFAFEGFVNKANLNVKDKDIRLIEAIAQSIK